MAIPCQDIIKDYYVEKPLDRLKCARLMKLAKNAITSDDSAGYLREEGIDVVTKNMAVPAIIKCLKDYVKNSYSGKINQINQNTKKINDTMNKINDLLKHDKIARLKHGNDKVNYEDKMLVLFNKDNPTKPYKFQDDQLVWNSDYIVQNIDGTMESANATSDKAARLNIINQGQEKLLSEVNSAFYSDHEYITKYGPGVLNKKYTGAPLSKALKCYEEQINIYYNNTNYMNNIVDIQMRYLEVCQIAYNKESGKWGNTKEGRIFVDTIFKKMLEYATMSIDYNDKAIDIMVEIFQFTAKEIEAIYEIIKS